MRVMTLEQAVEEKVRNFIDFIVDFSVHDITIALRADVNNGLIVIPGKEMTSDSPFPYAVEHQEVRAIFRQLYDSYVRDYVTVNRGVYNFYSVNSNPSSLPSKIFPTTQVTSIAPVPTLNAPSLVKSVPSLEVERRICIYLANCSYRGIRPTLKMIQSAIKRGNASTGYKLEEIVHMLRKLGFNSRSVSANI